VATSVAASEACQQQARSHIKLFLLIDLIIGFLGLIIKGLDNQAQLSV
jgi:hypothetical protein